MKTCKTCVYWQREREFFPATEQLHQLGAGCCTRNTNPFWYAYKFSGNNDEKIIWDNEEVEDNKVFLQDGEDYRVDMITKADFGCVMFQGKTSDSKNENSEHCNSH